MFCLINTQQGPFLVVSVHFKPFEKGYTARKQELGEIVDFLESITNKVDSGSELRGENEILLFREAIKNNNIIILGDFNYNLPFETNEIYRQGFIDLWHELKPSEEKGYTYDPL